MYAAFLNLATAQAVIAMGYRAEGRGQGGAYHHVMQRAYEAEPRQLLCVISAGRYLKMLRFILVTACGYV